MNPDQTSESILLTIWPTKVYKQLVVNGGNSVMRKPVYAMSEQPGVNYHNNNKNI